MTDDDRIVADYLRRLRRAARGLPGARRRELIDEITAHIAEARLGGAVRRAHLRVTKHRADGWRRVSRGLAAR